MVGWITQLWRLQEPSGAPAVQQRWVGTMLMCSLGVVFRSPTSSAIFEAGKTFIDQALALNVNSVNALSSSGWLRVWLGEPETAIDHLFRGMRLSPFDPRIPLMQAAIAAAHFVAGRYTDASIWAEKAIEERVISPGGRVPLPGATHWQEIRNRRRKR